MPRMRAVISASFLIGLLCASSIAEEIGEFPCAAEDPIVPFPGAGRYYYQIVQKQFAWMPEDGLRPLTKGKIRVGVWFLDGNENQRADVREYASHWTVKYGAPIEWVFDNKDKNHIRITFSLLTNSSLYGREMMTLNKPMTSPTMKLGVYNEASPTANRIRQIIVHEFGHALGLMHEQLNALGKLDWNEEKVFIDYKDTNWCKNDIGVYIGDEDCRAKIGRQITQPVSTKHACVGAPDFDPTSIMMYDLWPGWTKQYPRGLRAMTDLSGKDLACVRKLYDSTSYPEPHPLPPPKPHPLPPPKMTQRCHDCCCYCPRNNFRRSFYRWGWEPDFWDDW